jgi:hypothetical protein
MFVYLDESGDTGFKFPASSRYFVIILLLVDDPIPLLAAINDLRKRLRFSEGNEFKFYNSDEHVRTAFMQMLSKQDFRVRALVIDKYLITSPQLKRRETFYNFLVNLVLSYDQGSISNAMLILDESVRSKKSKLSLSSYLRTSVNSDGERPKLREIRYHTSHGDTLIQAADMLSGAVYAMVHRGNDRWFQLVRHKFEDVWEWQP